MKAVTAALLTGAAMLACACSGGGSDGGAQTPGTDGGSEPDTSGSTPDFQVQPAAVYSGFDQKNTFQVPIAVYGAGTDLKVTPADPSAISVAPTVLQDPNHEDTGKWFMITIKKAGQTTLTASSGGKTEKVTVNVTTYAADRYETGKTRYANADGDKPACVTCHGKPDGPDHSPARLASVRDNQVESIITTGINTTGFPIDTDRKHRWEPNDTQLAGLVTYLRALPPRGFSSSP